MGVELGGVVARAGSSKDVSFTRHLPPQGLGGGVERGSGDHSAKDMEPELWVLFGGNTERGWRGQ